MAQLVAVLDQKYQLQKRQLPLVVDDTLTMVMEFSDVCARCCEHPMSSKSKNEIDTFTRNLSQLSPEEISSAIQISRVEVMNQLSQLVHCVGCRHSVERLFDELVDTRYLALDPLIITEDSFMTITEECRRNPKAIYTSLCFRRSHTALDLASKVKKGKRCPLHSIDLHKSKALWTWQEIWDVSTQQCQNHIVQIDNEALLVTVEEYLRKHRFCSECKAKVLRAYAILIDEPDASGKSDRSNSHCRALFREVRTCPDKHHIHVPCDEKYLKDLIERAEPELSGNQTERHAKSMEIAQEEVLTCLGVHLHDRFFRIQQKLNVEDKSWQLLFSIGMEGLRRNLEAAFERRRGRVELICQELMMEDSKCSASGKTQQSTKRPRQKKKKCKAVLSEVLTCNGGEMQLLKKAAESCQCTSNVTTRLLSSDANHNDVPTGVCSVHDSGHEHCEGDLRQKESTVDDCCESIPSMTHSDLGYASDIDCDSCSVQSQRHTRVSRTIESDVSHSSGCCSPSSAVIAEDVVDSCRCDQLGIKCRDCCDSAGSSSPAANRASWHNVVGIRYGTAPSLEDMLMASEDDDTVLEISEMEIRKYRDNEQKYATERLVLRQTLRQKFANLQQKRFLPWKCDFSCVVTALN